MMEEPLYQNVQFRYPFRDFQKRVLDSLEEKLQDQKIHIVAAPGSGKTVLGLEVIRRLGKKALILTPSISLREQWQDRFLTLFAGENRKQWESRLSDDLDRPGVLTCVTYQALYQRFLREDFETLPARYEQEGITVVCLDEAHHLKREWWKALEQLCGGIRGSVVLSLTATPPYDSADQEWSRYQTLCGEIDEEIFTPEMVQKGCLCPHQDYVALCVPQKDEEAVVRKERRENEERIRQILKEEALYRQIKAHPGLLDPEGRGKAFLEQPEYLTALLSYVRTYGKEQAYIFEKGRREAEAAFDLWDERIQRPLESRDVPPMDEAAFELLLKGILDFDKENYEPEFLEQFRQLLTKHHLLRNGRLVTGARRREIDGILKRSASKLTAIEEILRQEIAAMGENLRCVVLMDQVRKEDLKKVETEEGLTDLGCVPVFERLRRMEHRGNLETWLTPVTVENPPEGRQYPMRLGLLCASMVILPAPVMVKLPLPSRPLGQTDYARADIPEGAGKAIVGQVTELLSRGEITVLVGTAALLGEGWDAPCVNTVVLGSVACTYVQSNQMRGRGLRIDGAHPEKTANIWHLTTLEPDENCPGSYRGGEEYDRLCHRFETMIGLSLDGIRMENGIERLGLSGSSFREEEICRSRERMKAGAADRQGVRMQWRKFLDKGGDFSQVREVVPISVKPAFSLKRRDQRFSLKRLTVFAEGLCSAMKALHMLSSEAGVQIDIVGKKKAEIYLWGAPEKECLRFARALKQLCAPVESPRYLLRQKRFLRKAQFYAVPDCLGTKKEQAERLYRHIRRRGLRMAYTQSEEGRKWLLEARLSQLSVRRETLRIVKEVCIR